MPAPTRWSRRAEEKKLPVYRFAKYSDPEAQQTLKDLNADVGVMAYVLLFAPPEFCAIPKHGMIQFHPSLLPLHRGPAAIPWAIIRGRKETGLTIFRPTPGLDEGPVILQKRVTIGPDDTAASLYFDKIFPLGVEALVQAADLVVAGRATESTQDEDEATYEGWVREAESRINWANHVDFVYDLIRGCNPAPGAWTTLKSEGGDKKLYLFDAKKVMAPTFGAVRGKKLGEIVLAGPRGHPHPLPGRLYHDCSRLRIDDGAKIKARRRQRAGGGDDLGKLIPARCRRSFAVGTFDFSFIRMKVTCVSHCIFMSEEQDMRSNSG